MQRIIRTLFPRDVSYSEVADLSLLREALRELGK